jgi:hypothetical protein
VGAVKQSSAAAINEEDEFKVAQRFEEWNRKCAAQAFSREIALALVKKLEKALELEKNNNSTASDLKKARYNLLLESCHLLSHCRNSLQHCSIAIFLVKSERHLLEFYYNQLNDAVEKVTESVEELAKNHSKLNATSTLKSSDLQALKNRWEGFLQAATVLIKQSKHNQNTSSKAKNSVEIGTKSSGGFAFA